MPPHALRIGGTVRERAVRELRNRILTGVWSTGSRLDLDLIAVEFSTSRTPVREALLQLAHEGLVEIAPRSGVTVVGVTPADVLDSFSLLATLSGKAAEWAAERIDEEGLECVRQLARVVNQSADGDMVEANWNFHRAIHRAARSRQLLTLIRQAVRVVPTNFFEMFPDQEHHSEAEHDLLLAALAHRDSSMARGIAERHVLSAGESLAASLRHRGRAAGLEERDDRGPNSRRLEAVRDERKP